jgi:hypothetical protein
LPLVTLPTTLFLQAFQLFYEVDQEIKDIEHAYNCTDHNVSGWCCRTLTLRLLFAPQWLVLSRVAHRSGWRCRTLTLRLLLTPQWAAAFVRCAPHSSQHSWPLCVLAVYTVQQMGTAPQPQVYFPQCMFATWHLLAYTALPSLPL